jgi:hypothetical protein
MGWATPPRKAADQLLRHHWWWWRRRRSLLAGAKDGGSRDEGEDSDFHMCVQVLTSLLSPSTRYLAAGIFETNDKFYFCKQPNEFSAKTHKQGTHLGKLLDCQKFRCRNQP